MALNSSRGSSFSNPPEMGLYPSVGHWSLYNFNEAPEGNTFGERVKSELGDCDSQAAVAVDDVLDRLPMDPFDMDIRSTFTSISDSIQYYERDFQSGYDVFRLDETHKNIGDHTLFAGLNWGWCGAWNLQLRGGNAKGDEISFSCDDVNEFRIYDVLYDVGIVADELEELQNCAKIGNDGQGDIPHEIMHLVLGYLGIKDLLLVERVCKLWRDKVRTDPLLWRSIHVDQSLSARITDGTLVNLTSRAQGTLECLSLVDCKRITDSGLTSVLQSNPKLIKLSVPGCIKLTVEGILFNLRALKSAKTLRIKLLRIGGLADITDEHYKELKDLLGADKYFQQRDQKSKFYQGELSYLTCEDDRAIDVEICPRCQRPELVYDCSAESCRKKHQAAQLCRGCTVCIVRCIHCGGCIKDNEYQETFYHDILCLNCWHMLQNCPEKPVQKGAFIIGQHPSFKFYVHG